MATKSTVAREDEIEGGPADETARFAVGGMDDEIDLFAPRVDAHACLAFLFTAMEAIFGLFNSTVAGTGFVARAIAALHTGGIESEPLRSFLADEVPRRRNMVAHASRETLPARADKAIGQESHARGDLRCFVRFFHNVASRPGRDRIIAVLGQSTFAPRKAFNSILAAEGARTVLYGGLGQVPG